MGLCLYMLIANLSNFKVSECLFFTDIIKQGSQFDVIMLLIVFDHANACVCWSKYTTGGRSKTWMIKWSKRVQLSNGLVFKQGSKNRTKHVCLMVKNVRFSNGLLYHVIRPFENQTKKCPKIQMYGFQVFRIQMIAA